MSLAAPRKLAESDDLSTFCCGVEIVDDWLARHAHSAQRRGTAVVYVCFDGETLAGFYTLSAHSICREAVSGGWLRRSVPGQIPAVLLGMLGVDERYKGAGLGSSLLKDAIERSLGVSSNIGAKALVVDPAGDAVRSFYRKYGFREFAESGRMCIPLTLR